ncbi:ABC transporter ATP-binding protein [Undibacterium sp. FT137W]|uniref:ABC transporter ATP-binding protein n=2 Tax=Undibacterium fentianense TaxID=2828728 RepID=A0A941E162_9BURK|nr:ABC transporter ATP-binding protein [Undibacterium fentianense]
MLSTVDLTLRAGQRTLIQDLKWEVHAGECWCVIGRNGAGKSTLLRCLAGLNQSSKGQILLRGKELSEWSLEALARERAFLAQSRVDAFGYRVIETVLSARHPYHDTHYWESAADHEIAMDALNLLDVAELAQRDVRSLSGGERQRVAIAALIAQDARLLLLDEPANALDLSHQVSVMQILARECRRQQSAVIMVSHDLNLSYSISTHALLLMPDGSYLCGLKESMMQVNNLSLCLGHPIELIQHHQQVLFLPQM